MGGGTVIEAVETSDVGPTLGLKLTVQLPGLLAVTVMATTPVPPLESVPDGETDATPAQVSLSVNPWEYGTSYCPAKPLGGVGIVTDSTSGAEVPIGIVTFDGSRPSPHPLTSET